MSQLRAKLPKLDTSGNKPPASPNNDGFKTAFSTPTSSTPSSASPFTTPPPHYKSGPQTPDTPMTPLEAQHPTVPTHAASMPQNTADMIAHMQATSHNSQMMQMAMDQIQQDRALFNQAMTIKAADRKMMQDLAEAQAKTATAGSTAVKNLA